MTYFKKELRQLKDAHDAVANKQAQELLDLSRWVAIFEVNSTSNGVITTLDRKLPAKTSTMRTQVMTDAASCKATIMTSNEPFKLCAGFKVKWHKTVKDLGIDAITY